MGKSWGGARPGAGRKRKDRSGQTFYETAQDYLLGVVQGRVEPDSVRVMAARTLIQYERAKKRAPVESPPPSELRKKAEREAEKTTVAEFEKKAELIRKKYRG